MSYLTQADLSRDPDFLSRVSACAAVELPDEMMIQPTAWANDRIWWIAASPGFADAYEYAINTEVERPGANGAVITDGQILAAVQARIALEAGPTPEQP